MKLLTKVICIALLGVSFHLQAQNIDENKGVIIKPDSPTVSMGINSSNLLSFQNGNGVMRTTDVVVSYKYSDASGTGKQLDLQDNSSLKSGDKFTVNVVANKNVFVYLYHFDSNGEANELISMSGHGNYLKAGERLILPDTNKHFYLNDKLGKETIHTIVSPSALSDLTESYRNRPITNDSLSALVPKGISIGNDMSDNQVIIKHSPASDNKLIADGYVVQCPVSTSACRETFVINHLPR